MKKNRKWLSLVVAAGLFGTSAVMAQQGQSGTYPGAGSGSGPGMESGGSAAGAGSQGGQGMQRGGPQKQGERATPTGRPPGAPAAGGSMYEVGPFKQGDRLPAAYRDNQYVIDNWQAYNLPKPPRGQRWVGVGGDYLLVGRDNRIMRVESSR